MYTTAAAAEEEEEEEVLTKRERTNQTNWKQEWPTFPAHGQRSALTPSAFPIRSLHRVPSLFFLSYILPPL